MLTARESASELTRSEVAQIARECKNPDRFVEYARCAAVYPLAMETFAQLANADGDFVRDAHARLRSLCLQKWFPMRTYLMRVEDKVRNVLQNAASPFAFFKGMTFGEQFYLRPELRVANDVDVLIPEWCADKVERAMLGAGFRYYTLDSCRNAMRRYVGQLEFIDPATSIVVDITWKLIYPMMIGNRGARGTTEDLGANMDLIWERANALTGGEYRMSVEDAIVNVIKHACHGHGFERPLRDCADISAVMRSCAETLDWEYVEQQLRRAECLRAAAELACFHDTYYSESGPNKLLPRLSGAQRLVRPIESRCFSRTIILGQMPLARYRKRILPALVSENLQRMGAMWTIDRGLRLIRMASSLAMPTRDELFLLAKYEFRGPYFIRRIVWYFSVLLVLPGILAGSFAAVIGYLVRVLAPSTSDIHYVID
jgi:hypothetical protein